MDCIGVRELRQYASRHLARVASGESIQITDRGRPVAPLVPATNDPWDEMIVIGQVTLATGDGSVLDELPVDYEIRASHELSKLRDDDR